MKSLLKNIFIRPLASPFISSLAMRFFGCGVPIFLLHRISEAPNSSGGISADHLRDCLQYLVDNDYSFISLEALLTAISEDRELPKKPVVFTMDDGFIDQAHVAAPIFLEYGCPLTFFIISGLVDQRIWPWDAQISWIINATEKDTLNINFADEVLRVEIDKGDGRHNAREVIRNYFKEVDAGELPALLKQLEQEAGVALPESVPQQYRALDWETARQLESQGVQFAPHTITHRILSKLDADDARQEITESWQTLKKELNNPLNVFCYPTGRRLDFGPREIDILRKENFLGAVSTMPGYVEPYKQASDSLFSLPRFELPVNKTDFIQYCSWIEHAKHAEKR